VSRQQIVCIVARQRSGTTALQAILAHTGRVENFGEIFHTDRLEKRGSFFGYCRERKILLSDVATAPALAKLVQEYIAHLRALAEDRHVLIDVKYNSWEAVRPAWRYPQEEPYLLAVLKRMEALFIFIQRLDVAAQIVSGHIARANDQWQNLAVDGKSETPLELDIRKIEREARHICAAEVFLSRFLRKYKRVLRFNYETLYEDGNLSAAAQREISDAIEEPLKFPAEPPIRKSEVDKATSVRNYAEIVAAVEKVTAKHRRPIGLHKS
jgi:LPS sulfotransferase NodH